MAGFLLSGAGGHCDFLTDVVVADGRLGWRGLLTCPYFVIPAKAGISPYRFTAPARSRPAPG
jgi:hypothetical protein